MNSLQICPPHGSYVATLPWEIQKSYFQYYYSYTSDCGRFLGHSVDYLCSVAVSTVNFNLQLTPSHGHDNGMSRDTSASRGVGRRVKVRLSYGIELSKVIRPTRHKIGHLGNVLPSKSLLGSVPKKLNPTKRS